MDVKKGEVGRVRGSRLVVLCLSKDFESFG